MNWLDAMIPIELTDPNPRTMTMIKDRERDKVKKEDIKQQMARKYNKKVNP